MGTATSLTAARMQEIANSSISGARLENFNLILTTVGGDDINLGAVKYTPAEISDMVDLKVTDKNIPGLVDQSIQNSETVKQAVANAALPAVNAVLVGKDILLSTDLRVPVSNSAAGVAYAIVDLSGLRSWVEVGFDGRPTEHAARLIAEAIFAARDTAERTSELSGLMYAIVDKDGRRSWLEIGPDGGPTANSVAMIQKAVGAGPATQYKDSRGVVSPVVPASTVIRAYGDSTTQGVDFTGDYWVKLVSDALGIPVSNMGAAGGISPGITARLGGFNATGRLDNNLVPASGSVYIRELNVNPVQHGDQSSLLVDLRTQNNVYVRGTIERVSINGSTSETVVKFTPQTPGTAVPANGISTLYSVTGKSHWGDILILGMGINDMPRIEAGEYDLNYVKRMYSSATSVLTPLKPRILVWGVLDRGPSEMPGTTRGNNIAELERFLEQKYGSDFVNVRKYLSTRRALEDALYLDPTFTYNSVDTDAQDRGTVPPCFRTGSGSVHLNQIGHRLQAWLFVRHMTSPQKGWF